MNDKNAKPNESHPNEQTATAAITDDQLREKALEKERSRKRQRVRRRMAGYIRSRKFKRKSKQIKAEAIAEAETHEIIARPELPYKKFRNPMLEIISQNEILENRTRTNRRTSQPFVYNPFQTKSRSVSPKKVLNQTMPELGKDVSPSSSSSSKRENSRKVSKSINEKNQLAQLNDLSPRTKRRINYSEDLIDEAFMYEQILDNKQHLEKKTIHKKSAMTVISGASNIDSRLRLLEERKEISIMPVKSRMTTKQEEKKETKSEPLFNITSSVSVHIKSRKSNPSTSTEPSVPALHIRRVQNGYETVSTKKGKVKCKHCSSTFDDLKALAIHQLKHLTISAHKIDSERLLHPRLRRVSSH